MKKNYLLLINMQHLFLLILSLFVLVLGVVQLVFALAFTSAEEKDWKKIFKKDPPKQLKMFTVVSGVIFVLIGLVLCYFAAGFKWF